MVLVSCVDYCDNFHVAPNLKMSSYSYPLWWYTTVLCVCFTISVSRIHESLCLE